MLLFLSVEVRKYFLPDRILKTGKICFNPIRLNNKKWFLWQQAGAAFPIADNPAAC